MTLYDIFLKNWIKVVRFRVFWFKLYTHREKSRTFSPYDGNKQWHSPLSILSGKFRKKYYFLYLPLIPGTRHWPKCLVRGSWTSPGGRRTADPCPRPAGLNRGLQKPLRKNTTWKIKNLWGHPKKKYRQALMILGSFCMHWFWSGWSHFICLLISFKTRPIISKLNV